MQGYDVTNPPAPIPTAAWSGHTFSGWYTAAQGGRLVTALDGSVKGKTLYAHWDETQQPTEPEPTEPEPTVPAPTEPKPTEPVQKSVEVTVTGDYVNVRKGPGTGYDVVTGVSAGQKLTITETAEGSGYTWGKFSSGWICLKYTNYDKAVSGGDTPAPAQPVMGTVYDQHSADPQRPRHVLLHRRLSQLRHPGGNPGADRQRPGPLGQDQQGLDLHGLCEAGFHVRLRRNGDCHRCGV